AFSKGSTEAANPILSEHHDDSWNCYHEIGGVSLQSLRPVATLIGSGNRNRSREGHLERKTTTLHQQNQRGRQGYTCPGISCHGPLVPYIPRAIDDMADHPAVCLVSIYPRCVPWRLYWWSTARYPRLGDRRAAGLVFLPTGAALLCC